MTMNDQDKQFKTFPGVLVATCLIWFAFILAIAIPSGVEALINRHFGAVLITFIFNMIIASGILSNLRADIFRKVLYSSAMLSVMSIFFYIACFLYIIYWV